MKRTLVVAVAVLVIILGLVAYAGAANTHTIDVTASVRPKLTLDLSTASVVFADRDPDGGPASVSISATVQSNRGYDLTHQWLPLASTALSDDFDDLTGATAGVQPGTSHPVSVTFTPTWDLEGSQVGTLQFTATQN
jgi:hypothetical protein